MAVTEHGRRIRARVQPVGIDERVNVALDQTHVVQPDPAQMVGQPLGGAAHILLVGRERADARDPQPRLQLLQLARAGSVQIGGEVVPVFI